MIDNLGENTIFRWHFYDNKNCKHFVDVELSLKLSLLRINESIFHYKTRGCIFNFIKNSQTEVSEINVKTNETTILNVNFDDYNISNKCDNNNNNIHYNNNNINNCGNGFEIGYKIYLLLIDFFNSVYTCTPEHKYVFIFLIRNLSMSKVSIRIEQ